MTASRLRAAALYEPLTQHSSADILFYRIRNFNILSAVDPCKKDIFVQVLANQKTLPTGNSS